MVSPEGVVVVGLLQQRRVVVLVHEHHVLRLRLLLRIMLRLLGNASISRRGRGVLRQLDGRDVDALRLLVEVLDLRLLDRRREGGGVREAAVLEHELKLTGGRLVVRLSPDRWLLLLLKLLDLLWIRLLLLLLVQEASVIRGLQ